MKNSRLSLLVSMLLLAGVAHASDVNKDVSATLSITGNVIPGEMSCTVQLNRNVVSLSSNISELVAQGEDLATKGEIVVMNITGDTQCQDAVSAGKMAYKMLGTADNASGTVLANTDTSENAAKGVGVGIFDRDLKPLKINSDSMKAKEEDNWFVLQMVKLAGQEATAGNVESSMTIEIERL